MAQAVAAVCPLALQLAASECEHEDDDEEDDDDEEEEEVAAAERVTTEASELAASELLELVPWPESEEPHESTRCGLVCLRRPSLLFELTPTMDLLALVASLFLALIPQLLSSLALGSPSAQLLIASALPAGSSRPLSLAWAPPSRSASPSWPRWQQCRSILSLKPPKRAHKISTQNPTPRALNHPN